MGILRRRTRCRRCQAPLEGENLRIGCCDGCVAAEERELKKRIQKSLVGGVVLVVLLLAARHYACSAWYMGEYGEVIVPVWTFVLRFKPERFEAIMHPSALYGGLMLLYAFCLPFSSFVKLEYQTHRHEAEKQLSGGDPLVYHQVVQFNNQRTDDVGMFIISFLIALVSGPFSFVYKLYQWRQMSGYLKSH